MSLNNITMAMMNTSSMTIGALIPTTSPSFTPGGMEMTPPPPINATLDPIYREEQERYQELFNNFDCTGELFKFETFTNYMIGVSALMILAFCFMKIRVHNHEGCLNGRPGLCYPIKLIEESHDRFIYVAAFAVTAWSMFLISTNAVQYTWTQFVPRQLHGIAKLLNCIIIGILYYPIFAGLSSHHWIGYILGFLYTLAMAVCFVLTTIPCNRGDANILMLIDVLEFLPILIFYAVICIYFTYLLVKLALNRGIDSIYNEHEIDVNSKEYKRVKNLLRKSHEDYNPFDAFSKGAVVKSYGKNSRGRAMAENASPATTVEQVKSTAKDLAMKKIYAHSNDFKYSTSVLTAVALSLLIIYIILLKAIHYYVKAEWMAYKMQSIELWARKAKGLPEETKDFISTLASTFLDENTTATIVETLKSVGPELGFWIKAIKGIYLFSVMLCFVLCVLLVLDILRKYKRDLLLMQRGIYEYIPRWADQGPVSIVRGALKFTGYQAGFAASGFILMLVVTVLVVLGAFVFAAVIFRYGQYWILLRILDYVWPLALVFILIFVSQILLIRFCFLLKKNGRITLALDNRHFFFNVQFFMVFINAALGLLSSILTILKSVFFGIWTLPRLDMSAFPRTFEQFDPGFSSYCAMLKFDHTQRNQVLLVFTSLMLNGIRRRNAKAAERGTGARRYIERKLRKERIRHKWALAVTLINNPGLNLYRKLVTEPVNEKKILKLAIHPQMAGPAEKIAWRY